MRFVFCLLALFHGLCLPAPSPATPSSTPQLLSVRMIWDAGPHNAFTDLVRHDGWWYCTFREGAHHGVALGGAARVLRSADGEHWTSVAFFTSPGVDYRDHHLVITADNRLMLYAAAATPVAIEGVTHRNFAWFSANGTDWTEAVEIGEPNLWLWRITWHAGVAYGIGYHWTPSVFIRLYTSTDGIHFTPLVANMGATGTVNESSRIIFLPDGTAQVLVRDARWGTSVPPYTQWNWTPTNLQVGGPEMLRIPDGRYVAVTRLYTGTVRTSLSWVDPATGTLTECLTLPSGGDTSYAGVVWHEDRLWISYYSSHEGKSRIYLAQVAFPQAPLTSITDTFTRTDSDDLGSTEEPTLPWIERQTPGMPANVARIEHQQLLLSGLDGSGPAGSGPGVAALDVELPDLVISADLRFGLNNPAASFGNNTAGFLLRRPRSDANMNDTTSAGQISVQMHPGGGIYIGQKDPVGTTITALFVDNPFVPGQQGMAQVNSFWGPGSLPTAINGAPFDADGDGVLEAHEPFRLTVLLAGGSIQVSINGQEVAGAAVNGTSSSPNNYVGLLKNRWTSNSAGAPAHAWFDNLHIVPVGFNDRCADAPALTTSLVTGTTLGATPDGTASCAALPGGPDVWYRYTAPGSGDLKLEVCGADLKPVVSVLAGCDGQELGCGTGCGQSPCASDAACVTVPVIQGRDYWIRVAGDQGTSGQFELRLALMPPSAVFHRAAENPLTEPIPWTLDTNASVQERLLEPGEAGRPHWRIAAAADRRANYQYKLSPSQWSDPAGWTLTARVRPLLAPALYQCCMEVNDDRDAWVVSLVTPGGATPAGLWTSSPSAGAGQHLAAFDPSREYQQIQMIYDPTADGGQGAVSYFLNGQPAGMQTRAQALDRSLGRVVWGDNVSAGGQSESRWAFVSFEIGQKHAPACSNPFADADEDGDVDQEDFGVFQSCMGELGDAIIGTEVSCSCLDIDESRTIDSVDFAYFLHCASGPAVPAVLECDD